MESVNEKIEGFFYVCLAHGLTGEQGVVIPEENMVNVNLGEDISDAVRQGLFHIYKVKTIDEALEVMNGVAAEDVQSLVRERLRTVDTPAVDLVFRMNPTTTEYTSLRQGQTSLY